MLPFAFDLNPVTMLILLLLGVMLYGKKLPDIGRQLGQSLLELKRGMSDLGDQATTSMSRASEPAPSSSPSHSEEAQAPKFEPPK